jgi:transposase InsO family protein
VPVTTLAYWVKAHKAGKLGEVGKTQRPLTELEMELARTKCDLAEHGIHAGICRIRRIRKKLGIRCKQKRKFKATTDSKHRLPVAENLLNQQFEASRPNSIWVSDITYIPTDEGWLYMAGHKDLFNGEIVGYAMGERLTKSLVSQSLFRAVAAKRPAKDLIHHSDRGSQYCSYESGSC